MCRDASEVGQSVFDAVSTKVRTDPHVLASVVIDRILRECDRSVVVVEDGDWCVEVEAEIRVKLLEPQRLLDGFSAGHELGFGCG